MKKILCFMLTVTFIFSICVAASEDENNIKSDKAILLQELGIIGENTTSSEAVTRGAFSKLIYSISGKNQSAAGSERTFTDVNKENELYTYVNFVCDMGLMSSYEDGGFQPENNISYHEAIAVLVRFLGYDSLAEAKGGFPAGYEIVAAGIELTKNVTVKNSESITYDEAYLLLYNSLFVNLSEQTSYGETVEYSSKFGNTILNRAY